MIIIVQIEAIRIHAPHNMAARSATQIIAMLHAASTPIVVTSILTNLLFRRIHSAD
jgi:hypothetical protein